MWYKFCKDYVAPIVTQNNQLIEQTDFSPGLETSIIENQKLKNKNKLPNPDTWSALNSFPNTMQAGGVGAEYNLKEHDDINMPYGGDNFIDKTEWNS